MNNTRCYILLCSSGATRLIINKYDSIIYECVEIWISSEWWGANWVGYMESYFWIDKIIFWIFCIRWFFTAVWIVEGETKKTSYIKKISEDYSCIICHYILPCRHFERFRRWLKTVNRIAMLKIENLFFFQDFGVFVLVRVFVAKLTLRYAKYTTDSSCLFIYHLR